MRENAGRQVGDRCFGNPAWVKDLMSEPSVFPILHCTTTNRVILVIIFPKEIKKKKRKRQRGIKYIR